MVIVAAVWFLVGLIVIVGMLIFTILKQINWKTFGISTSIYIVVLFFLFVIAGSQPVSTSTSSSSNKVDKKVVQKPFKIVSKADDDEDYQTDSNGNFNLKIKALKSSSIKLTCEDNEVKSFKPKTLNLKRGQTVSIPISLSTDEIVPTFVIKASNGYKKEFDLYNNSKAVNSSMSAKESSEAASESASDDSYQASLDKSKDNWNNGPDGEAIQVSKVWQDMHTTFIAVKEEDWNTLSETDKNSFTSDWTSSIQNIYKMSDKNGTTSIQVVSSSNHDHMLAHGTGSGKVEIDD